MYFVLYCILHKYILTYVSILFICIHNITHIIKYEHTKDTVKVH